MMPLLTVGEVAERLNASRSFVYQLVESGRLVAHRIGTGRGAIRVSEEDLASFLEASRQAVAGKNEAPEPPKRRLRHLRF